MKKLIIFLIIMMISAPAFSGNDEIKAFCQDKWPDNYRMQKYCLDQQMEANQLVWKYIRKHNLKGGPGDNLDDPYAKILHNCLRKWRLPAFDTHNFRMVNYCIEKQAEAYEQMK